MRGGWAALAAIAVLSGCIQVNVPDDAGSSVTTDTVGPEAGATYTGPVVDFRWSPESPKAGDKVRFSPSIQVLRGTSVASWSWDFGDGATSTKADPTHTFGSAGPKTVTLTVRSSDALSGRAAHVVAVAAGSGTSTASAADLPDPTIAVEDSGLGFRFSYSWTAGADSVGWDFGDGSTSNDPAPAHAYESPGEYTVSLHVLNGSVVRSAERVVTATSLLPTFLLSSVGESGPEPSVGVTSSGCIFFAALEKVMRSCDHGRSWSNVNGPLSSPVSFDPYLWVDPATDRIFNVQMIYLACTWISWSDDDGASWIGNPLDCGTIPVNDHIKLGSGPWAGQENPLNANPVYSQAVYFCMNKLVTIECCTSIDGGATFTLCQPAGSGGLHGAITTAPDGTVYVPPRSETPGVHLSRDNGLTWESVSMGSHTDTPDPRKNSELATDTASNAYHTWIAGDMSVQLSRSTDGGRSWDTKDLRASPPGVVSATFPQIAAGDPGRIAIAYLGSEDAHLLGTPDIDDAPWDGNPHTAPSEARYHLYVTFSLDALAPQPSFVTVKLTRDPVQVGSICISSGDCRDIGGSNRNLLDFNDLSLDRHGRVYVAYADGCTGSCASAAAPQPGDSRDDAGMVAILQSGPSLFAAAGDLKPL